MNGTRSAADVLKAIRRNARRRGWSVVQLPRRCKGSHSIWVVLDPEGVEIGRVGLTGHPGEMSQTVTRSNESALEHLFGKGWLD